MSETSEELYRRVEPIIERLRPVVFPALAGQPPELQGAVLGDLVAIWLAGHVVLGDPEGTEQLRRELLVELLKAVQALTPVNAKLMGLE